MKCRIGRHWLTGTGYTWIVLLMFASCGAPGTEGDYLSPELRARVEQLKKEAAASPTTAENLQVRTDIFWDWANAYTLTGGPIPANMPLWVVSIRMAATDGWEAPAPWLQIVDHYIEELTLKDEHPEGLGELKVASEAPLVAAQWATVEQTYTVGSRPMKPGGGFMVAKQSSQGPDPFQNEDPATDWYVTIRSSNPGAQFQRFTRSLDGMHGGRSEKETPTFILEGTSLQPGDTVTVTYGDTSGGSPGFRVQPSTTDELLFPLYIDLEGKVDFLTSKWPGLPIFGGPSPRRSRVRPFDCVGVGEAFEVSVRSEDIYLKPCRRIPAQVSGLFERQTFRGDSGRRRGDPFCSRGLPSIRPVCTASALSRPMEASGVRAIRSGFGRR